ncbi:MAG TPA: septum formation initiator family protein [Dongiaceae bacterium]|nr:septum formation initiator family protein [Dongiaceae bacterium]
MSRARADATAPALRQRLVRERDPARTKELLRFVLYGGAAALLLVAYVWQRVDFMRGSLQVQAVEASLADLRKSIETLRVQRSYLMNHDRIESLARKRLGLVDPDPGDVRRVKVGGGSVSEVLQPIKANVVPIPILSREPR